MKTRHIRIEEQNTDEELIRQAGDILRSGGLVAFPTETVYGLGGDALNPASSARIYQAKGRPSDNPLIVHIADMEALDAIVREIPAEARALAEAFWPGPLTMILPKADIVPRETTGGLETVAVRMPAHRTARELIRAAGGYVAAPSANRSGRPSPTLAKYVAQDLDGRIEMIIDGGSVEIGLESTIVDLTSDKPTILRPGYITRQMLERVLSYVEEDSTLMRCDTGQAPKAPGMKYRHYAPAGELTIVDGDREHTVRYINEELARAGQRHKRTAVIAADETVDLYRADIRKSVGSRGHEETVARELYRVLRELDDEEAEVIFAEAFDGDGIGRAVMNRLLKASGYHTVQV